jgi:NitT/TauT family transport system permease protein
MGNSKTVSAIAQPFIAFLRPIPMIAFVPVVILFFGIGETSKVVLISASVFFQVVMVTAAGVGGVPRTLLLAGKNVGYSGWSFYRRIVIPAAMPTIMTGVRMAAAVAWLLVVAAEMVAAQAGLGYMILDASNFFRIPYVYLGILLIGLIGLVIDTLLAALQRRVVHWEGK